MISIPRGVERSEFEDVLLAKVVDVLLQLVGEVLRHDEDHWPGRILAVHTGFVLSRCCGPEEERRARAAGAHGSARRWSVEAVLFEIGRVVRDQADHLRRLQPRDETLDDAEIRARLERLRHHPIHAVLDERRLDVAVRELEARGRVAVELQDCLVAQIERLLVEVGLDVCRNDEDGLFTAALSVHVAAGRSLAAQEQRVGRFVALCLEGDGNRGWLSPYCARSFGASSTAPLFSSVESVLVIPDAIDSSAAAVTGWTICQPAFSFLSDVVSPARSLDRQFLEFRRIDRENLVVVFRCVADGFLRIDEIEIGQQRAEHNGKGKQRFAASHPRLRAQLTIPSPNTIAGIPSHDSHVMFR